MLFRIVIVYSIIVYIVENGSGKNPICKHVIYHFLAFYCVVDATKLLIEIAIHEELQPTALLKYQSTNHDLPEFQVIFNGHSFNDFNTLFKSLPPNKELFGLEQGQDTSSSCCRRGDEGANFLQARAREVVPGGLVVIVLPARPNGVSHSCIVFNIMFDLMGSSLMDLANKGRENKTYLVLANNLHCLVFKLPQVFSS
ncbi:hypothetical protein ACJIZ3_014084 [Penstemon smallii]|uniref:Uncharacterized protein n=1 Tax=Penstemon smallii TaxID=265156 RepID=A0ABD3RQ76_9LAMI